MGSTQSTRPQNECGSRLRPVSLLRVLHGRDKVRLAESRRRTEHADEVRAPESGEIDGATPATPLGVAPIKIEAASTVVAAPTSDAVLAVHCLGTAGSVATRAAGLLGYPLKTWMLSKSAEHPLGQL